MKRRQKKKARKASRKPKQNASRETKMSVGCSKGTIFVASFSFRLRLCERGVSKRRRWLTHFFFRFRFARQKISKRFNTIHCSTNPVPKSNNKKNASSPRDHNARQKISKRLQSTALPTELSHARNSRRWIRRCFLFLRRYRATKDRTPNRIESSVWVRLGFHFGVLTGQVEIYWAN